MSEGERIRTRADFQAHLADLRERGGEPFEFELAVRSLATLLDGAVGWRGLLDLGQVGIAAFSRPPDVPSPEPPIFVGTSVDLLPRLQATSDLFVPRLDRLPDESPKEYGEYLAEHLLSWLSDHDVEHTHAVELAAAGYVLLFARDDFRALVPRTRSLDVHALCMLAAERSLRQVGGISLSEAEEEGFFRWLHLTSYADLPAAYLAEQAARRRIRLEHDRQPADEVAVMTCEVSVESLGYGTILGSVETTTMTEEQLRQTYRALSERADGSPEKWAARARGFDVTDRLDLTPAAAAWGPDYASYAHGHLLRWLLDHDVPVGPVRMYLASAYANRIVEYLVENPAEGRDTYGPVKCHLLTTYRLRRKEEYVSLTDELLFLSWVLCQLGGRHGVKLAGFLEQRDSLMAKVAARLREERR
jgi:hypothetical protein